MMLINLGSLQSIPDELYELRVDGASGWQQFWHVTLPLLLVSVAPLLVSCFAFNFNNFGVIYLVTQGRPPIPGARTPAVCNRHPDYLHLSACLRERVRNGLAGLHRQ